MLRNEEESSVSSKKQGGTMTTDEIPTSTSFTQSTEPKENQYEKDVSAKQRQHQGMAVASKREASASYMEQMRRLDERITHKTANATLPPPPPPPPSSRSSHHTTTATSSSTVADHLRHLDARIAQKTDKGSIGGTHVLLSTIDTTNREKGFTMKMAAWENSLSELDKDHEKQLGTALSILDGPKSSDEDGAGGLLGVAPSGGGTRNRNNHPITSDMETGGGGQDDDHDGSDLRGLAIAEAVKDGEEGDVPAAIEFDPDSKPIPSKVLLRRYRIRAVMMVGGGVILLLIAVGLVATIAITAKNDSNNNNLDDTTLTTLPPTTYRESLGIQDEVEKFVGSEKLNDPTSPYYQALQWILHHDPRQVGEDDPSLLQRYLHVLFYMSTTQKTPWASCNPPSSTYAPPLAWTMARNTTSNSTANDSMKYPQDNLEDDDHADEDDSCLFLTLQSIDPFPTYFGLPAIRWLTQHHECTWAGVICDELNQTRELRLPSQNISGPLPVELTLFPSLHFIDLSWNLFTGSLPSEYATSGMAEQLISLDLLANELTGSIPDVYWTRMPNLMHLNLGFNSLTGKILGPSSLSYSSLAFLGLYANLFTGSIPIAWMEKCTTLTELWLYDNFLTGTIPSEFGSLTTLASLRLHRNYNLEGSLPTELGSLAELSEFWIHKTNIGGTIPSEMVGPKMMMLSDLRLHSTSLTGLTIPTELWNLTNLRRLDLYETQISGSIPTEIAQLSNLVILRLRDMPNLSSTIPTEIGMLTKLAHVWLEGTNVTGPIPQALCAIRPSEEVAAAVEGEGVDFLFAVEGVYFFSELTADCHSSLSSSEAANSCPMGCCTLCCDRDLGNCTVPTIALP